MSEDVVFFWKCAYLCIRIKAEKAMGRLKKIIKEKMQGSSVENTQERTAVEKSNLDDKMLHLTEVSQEELLRWRIDAYPYLI